MKPIDSDTVFSFFTLAMLNAICWLNVFSKRFRRWNRRLHFEWSFRKINKEQMRLDDALSLALSIVFGMFFSLIAILFLVSLIT
jgi:hypothetical protein